MLVQVDHHPAVAAVLIHDLKDPGTQVDGPLRGVARLAPRHHDQKARQEGEQMRPGSMGVPHASRVCHPIVRGAGGVAVRGMLAENAHMTPPDRLASLMSLLEKDPDDAFCLYGIAQEHAGRGDHEEAISWYRKAAESDPDDGYIHYHLARSLEALDRMPEAIAAVRDGIVAADRSGDAHARSELDGLLDELQG